MTALVVRGHALAASGAPLDANGRHTQTPGRFGTMATAGPGHARCSCGEVSPVPLPSLRARRNWHRNIHKVAVLNERSRS